MTMAIDTCVMLAIFKGEHSSAQWSEAIVRFKKEGARLVVCAVVWAELANNYSEEWQLVRDLQDLGIDFDPFNSATSYWAGRMFLSYRKSGGPRRRILPDFLVGAHAQRQADGLITHDSGFMRDHFNFEPIGWIEAVPILGVAKK